MLKIIKDNLSTQWLAAYIEFCEIHNIKPRKRDEHIFTCGAMYAIEEIMREEAKADTCTQETNHSTKTI